MKLKPMLAVVTGVALVGQPTSAGPNQPVSGPVAVYWMSASTTSGMGGMGGAGQRPSMSDMMAMGMGGGPGAAHHALVLQLGSSLRPGGGEPQAEHDPPAGLGAGAVLPLLSPEPTVAAPSREEETPSPPPQYRQPHGRMLIFWGCGEHAGPNQPLVIDFSQLDQAGAAQRFMAMSRGLAVTPMKPPSPSRNATYGEWPNRETRTSVPANGSLQGDHVVRGNYSPQINFSLAANQDFLPPFQLTTNAKNPSGSATLAWRPVDGAAGYFATMMGARDRDQIVMWSSSASQVSAFALPDYLSTGDIGRLVAANTLMPPAQTSCIIPQEAVAAAGSSGFFQLAAYGDETNIAYPPRPPAPRPWNIAWEVKVRYRSSTSGIVGVDMGGRMGRQSNPNQPPPKKRPGLFNPLGGFGGMIP